MVLRLHVQAACPPPPPPSFLSMAPTPPHPEHPPKPLYLHDSSSTTILHSTAPHHPTQTDPKPTPNPAISTTTTQWQGRDATRWVVALVAQVVQGQQPLATTSLVERTVEVGVEGCLSQGFTTKRKWNKTERNNLSLNKANIYLVYGCLKAKSHRHSHSHLHVQTACPGCSASLFCMFRLHVQAACLGCIASLFCMFRLHV